VSRSVRVLFFGTYDARVHPRVAVLIEGFDSSGDEVVECNEPLGADTAARVRILQKPWLVPVLVARIAVAWWRLYRRARRLPRPHAVVVGYMGHFDVHLARRLWPGVPLVLDQLVFAADTASDRGVDPGLRTRLLGRIDRAAVGTADVVCIDTEEHRALLPPAVRTRAVVVPVGAPLEWFRAPQNRLVPPLRVVFFGLYTPLQGAPVIGEAIARLADAGTEVDFTMIGRGQDYDATRSAAAGAANARWLDWVGPAELPARVAEHDVCLGIFGMGAKAARVVPNKVFQGAAAGCAIVTSDTGPQRDMLGAAAMFVPPGDAAALAATLRRLAREPDLLSELRVSASRRAEEAFRPAEVVSELRQRLLNEVRS
jgi:glycosyltransferase involved in cell wall biosynthesis